MLLLALAPLIVERSQAVRRRGLHTVHQAEPRMVVEENAVEGLWDTTPAGPGMAIASAELVEESLSDGLQYCPNNVTGYSSWAALQMALEKNKDDDLQREPYYLCPGIVYDALNITLMISHDYATIQCADLTAICVVQHASIMIQENLVGIRFEGIEFYNPAGAIIVGKGSHTYFVDSSIQEAEFNQIEELQAPIVSFGHLYVIGSLFFNNTGHGAIWALDDTLYVDRTKFEHNHAVSFISSAAAIHIGGSADPNAMVATSITSSCFMDNKGYHIALVEGARASVSWSSGNAVDAEAECPGITTNLTAAGGYCRPFEVLGTSTCDAILSTPTLSSAPAVATPVSSNETSTFNTSDNVYLPDPSRLFEPLKDPAVESAEDNGGEGALAEAAGQVTFTSSASSLYGLPCRTTAVAGVFMALLAIVSLAS
jgi:hypothetical protein